MLRPYNVLLIKDSEKSVLENKIKDTKVYTNIHFLQSLFVLEDGKNLLQQLSLNLPFIALQFIMIIRVTTSMRYVPKKYILLHI